MSKKNIIYRNGFFEWGEALIIAVFTVILTFIYIARPVTVDGASMYPTLENGEKLITSNFNYTPDYGDIIVFTKESFSEESVVKRIIATGGQVVNIDYKTGEVTVDGVVLKEDYINELTHLQGDVSFPVTVPEGELFVMGDNRNHSSDSRVTEIGFVAEELILGQVVMRIFPLNKIGKVD